MVSLALSLSCGKSNAEIMRACTSVLICLFCLSQQYRTGTASAVMIFLASVQTLLVIVHATLPPFDKHVQDDVLKRARASIASMPASAYTNNEHWSCAMGNWGDGPQCDEWDRGFSPCYPSASPIWTGG